MAFSVARSRPFRSLGLYRSSGKHAARKGSVPSAAEQPTRTAPTHRPAHAAAMPRLTGPHADGPHPDETNATGENAA